MATKPRILVGALLVVGVVLVPTPAPAKGAASAEITGPGLDPPIELDTSDLSANQLAEKAGLFAILWSDAPNVVKDRRPPGRLGPRYVVAYNYMVGQDEQLEYVYEPIRQRIYPFARDGAVAYVPPGQRLFDRPVSSGWVAGGVELRDVLVAAGVPRPRST